MAIDKLLRLSDITNSPMSVILEAYRNGYRLEKLWDETLFLIDDIYYYNSNRGLGIVGTSYGRPDTSTRTGCPGEPDSWHNNCVSSCGGSYLRPSTLQAEIDLALARGTTYVVVTYNFYNSYKTQVDNYIARGNKIYLLTYISDGHNIDGHCYNMTYTIIGGVTCNDAPSTSLNVR